MWNGKYVIGITDNSAITCDEIINTTTTVPTITVPTKSTSTNIYILLAFLWSKIVLLIAISVYCSFIKYQRKQNNYYRIASQIANLKKFYINNCIINMESNHKLKENQIENCTFYYFDGRINLEGHRCIISGIGKSEAIYFTISILLKKEGH